MLTLVAEEAMQTQRHARLPSTAAQLHYAAQKSIELEHDEQRARNVEYRAQLQRQVAEMQAKRKADAALAAPVSHE